MSHKFKIQAAGLCVEVMSDYSSPELFPDDYIVFDDIPADFSISVGIEDIDYERSIYLKSCEFDGIKPENYCDKYFASSAIFRNIAEQLPFYNGLAFHGSAVCVDDSVYIFTARSGVGKSTHAALWHKYFGDKAIIINDDKPFLRILNGFLYAYGSTWSGKHNLSSPLVKPVKAICILERSSENHIREISFEESSAMLIQQCLRPRKSDSLVKLIQILDNMDKYVKFYRMGCNTDISSVKMSYDFMNSDENHPF